MATEFDLIRRFFYRPARSAALGPGDDAALLRPDPGMELAVSADMLVEGVHFPSGTDARLIGHKSLAVNLSDMAAMGATPRWATLSIALPSADERWVGQFAAGLFALAERFGVELIGGDTTRGPLTISISILGEVPRGLALRRAGARPGDDLWVSGELGGAALGLARPEIPEALRRLQEPEPRVALGERLRGIATSAIDVSDGLVSDLGHILECSAAGAQLDYARLPRAAAFAQLGTGADAEVLERRCVLSGGDDYELLFTAAPSERNRLAALSRELALPLARIGAIRPAADEALPLPLVLDARGEPIPVRAGYDHFAATP